MTVAAPVLRLQAPAKLNTFLHIVGRRANGYHELQSVFVLIDWCDEIELRLREDGAVVREVRSNSAGVVFEGDDLCTRAAHALKARAGERGASLGANIVLHKHIPAQAGMGGGSSDAASVLIGLNQLWALGLTLPQLCEIGLGLGADVPFFIHAQHAWVEGIGEHITALPSGSVAAGTCVLVVKPAQGIATADIFRAKDLKRDTPKTSVEDFIAAGLGFGHNDLQPVAKRICPELGEALRLTNRALNRSSQHPLAARMTGSGSAVFAFTEGAIPELAELPRGWQARLCRLL